MNGNREPRVGIGRGFQIDGSAEGLESCTEPGVAIFDTLTETSDGIRLRVIDFIPPSENALKPSIVFVAGWISMISAWKEVLKVLTPRFRTLYIETREKRSAGIDWSNSPDFSIYRMTLDLGEIIEERIPPDRPFCIAGSSLGSTVILEYLALGSRSPLLAIVIAPNAEFKIPSWFYTVARFIPTATYGAVKELIKWHLRKHRIDSKKEKEQVEKYERSLDWADPRRLKAGALTMKGYSLWPKLPLIKAPVIIIGAESDTLHGLYEIRRMKELIPGARLEVMKSNRETHSEKAGRFMLEQINAITANKDFSG
ncbi:MAG: alpha/beta fold hydrolase [Syntrophales bacterium]|nr:alpha/beta fold hydrolase [Syntrophales bacterium]